MIHEALERNRETLDESRDPVGNLETSTPEVARVNRETLEGNRETPGESRDPVGNLEKPTT